MRAIIIVVVVFVVVIVVVVCMGVCSVVLEARLWWCWCGGSIF